MDRKKADEHKLDLRGSFKKKLEELFYADLRSLALLRIGIAIMLLVDLATRICSITQDYTDKGIIPRDAAEAVSQPYSWSLYFLNGSYEFSLALFIITLILALMLLFGYKTRITTILSYIMLVSLNNRNPIIIDGSDIHLQVILFWGIFLPWNARYSIDFVNSKILRSLPNRVFSFGILGYFLQICFIYVTTSIFKSGPEWTLNYSAIHYALSYDIYALPLAKVLLRFPQVLTILTFFVKWYELFGTLLFFFPFYTSIVRIIAISIFMLMHLGIGSTLLLGLFPFISIVSFFGLLPTLFWESLFKWLKGINKFKLKIYYDSDCGFCWKIVYYAKTFFLLPNTEIIPANSDSQIFSLMQKENSFIVEERSGQRHFRSEAIFAVIKASPVLFPFALISNIPGSHRITDKVYNFIARRRHVVCPVTYKKNENSGNLVIFSLPVNFLALFFMTYILFWNIQHFFFFF